MLSNNRGLKEPGDAEKAAQKERLFDNIAKRLDKIKGSLNTRKFKNREYVTAQISKAFEGHRKFAAAV
ncbi:MAG: hypothetical protein ACPLTR_10265 [Thermacetogeniaceae bacterium]